MCYSTIDLRGSHITNHIKLWIYNYLQCEEFVQNHQYSSVILSEKNKVIRVDGDILIVIYASHIHRSGSYLEGRNPSSSSLSESA